MSDGSNQAVSAPEQPRASLFGRRPKLRSPAESLQPQAAPPPPPPPPGRKKRREGLSWLSGLLSFLLIAAVVVLAGFGFAMVEARKPGPLEADKVVLITRDDDGGSIPDQLERAGIIESPLWFNLTLLLDGNRGKLKRGEYLFKEHVSLREAEDVLISGKVVLHKVTVPEGLTSDQVVQRLRDNDVFIGGIKEIPREGSILPETYEFERGVARAKVLSVMESAQAKAVDEIWKNRAPDLPIKSPGELVTLASIVEKETGKADERAHVAGVFINRLQKRMKLESDPTIVYGLVGGKGTLGHSISRSELQQATPYNTYIIEGLPPGPITNPGKAAMEAVANPLHTQDLFFVADGTGGHAFAETLDQHQKNVAHWRQIEKDAKDKLAPDATPPGPAAPPPKFHGALDPVDPNDVRRPGAGRRAETAGNRRSRQTAWRGSAPIGRRVRLCSAPAARCRPAQQGRPGASPISASSCRASTINRRPTRSTPTTAPRRRRDRSRAIPSRRRRSPNSRPARRAMACRALRRRTIAPSSWRAADTAAQTPTAHPGAAAARF